MKKEKKLYFLPELLQKIKTGEKTETRRLFKVFKKGDILKAVSRKDEKDFVFIKIVSCKKDNVFNITEEDAKKEGFESVEDFLKTWHDINLALNIKEFKDIIVNVIVFEYLAEEG